MTVAGYSPGISEAFRNAKARSKSKQRRQTPPPFSLRLTIEERSRLEYDAGDQPIGGYIRSKLFDDAQPRQRRRQKRPVKDHQALGRLLGELGKSRLANITSISLPRPLTAVLFLSRPIPRRYSEMRAPIFTGCVNPSWKRWGCNHDPERQPAGRRYSTCGTPHENRRQ